mmetsp:Transcript_60591/g.70889  ORF Transcript_60591/g.70889 Transcript_60591/m.70889 type:complete len:486 (-) Transcript_60591:197-1654(-)
MKFYQSAVVLLLSAITGATAFVPRSVLSNTQNVAAVSSLTSTNPAFVKASSLGSKSTEEEQKMNASDEANTTLVVGGGLAGLATALALRNIAGLSEVRIVEASTDESFNNIQEGAGVQLGPNGLRALRFIGGEALLSKIMENGVELKGTVIVISSKMDPMVIPDTAEADTGLSQVFIPWGVMRSLLAEQLPSDSISTGVGGDITGYQPVESTIQPMITPEKPFLPQSFDLVVGADGAASTFRHLIQNDATFLPPNKAQAARRSDLKDGGRMNIKAVVPKKMDEASFKPGHSYAHFAAGGGVACFAGPASADSTYWAISIADEKKDEETEDVFEFLSDIDRGDNNAVKQTLLSKLKGLELEECQFVIDLIESTEAECIYLQRSIEAESIGPSLVSKDNNIVLVGDAAHCMSNSYGQSSNFAFEDAASLAVCIRDGKDLGSALETFSESRVARCIEMQTRSAERAAKAMKGEQVEDVSKWIFEWDIQ